MSDIALADLSTDIPRSSQKKRLKARLSAFSSLSRKWTTESLDRYTNCCLMSHADFVFSIMS